MASPLAFAFDRHSWSGYASVQTDRGSEPTQPVSLHHQSLDFLSHRLCSFYFFLSFTFSSDGLIIMTVAASISGYIVYSISNLEWIDGWMDGWIPTHSIEAFSCTDHATLHAQVFSYTPLAVLCAEFLLHHLCCFMWGVSLTHPLLFYVGSFPYMPLAVLCGE